MTQGNSEGAKRVEAILHGELLAIFERSDTPKQSPSELPSDNPPKYDQTTVEESATETEGE